MHTTTHNPPTCLSAYLPIHDKKPQCKLRNQKPTKLWSNATQWIPVYIDIPQCTSANTQPTYWHVEPTSAHHSPQQIPQLQPPREPPPQTTFQDNLIKIKSENIVLTILLCRKKSKKKIEGKSKYQHSKQSQHRPPSRNHGQPKNPTQHNGRAPPAKRPRSHHADE